MERLTEIGTFDATVVHAAVCEKGERKAPAFELALETSDGKEITHVMFFTKRGADGSDVINDYTMKTLTEVFGWQTDNLEELQQIAVGKPVSIVTEQNNYVGRDGIARSGVRVKYLNAPGGRRTQATPENVKSVAQKLGSLLRAAKGTRPAPPPKPAPKAPAKPAMPAPPATETYTADETWARFLAYCEAMEITDETEINAAWYEFLKTLGISETGSLTSADWYRVYTAIPVETESAPF